MGWRLERLRRVVIGNFGILRWGSDGRCGGGFNGASMDWLIWWCVEDELVYRRLLSFVSSALRFVLFLGYECLRVVEL